VKRKPAVFLVAFREGFPPEFPAVSRAVSLVGLQAEFPVVFRAEFPVVFREAFKLKFSLNWNRRLRT
jgi:hypothetical protein